MEGVINVQWYGQDYLYLKWYVMCSALATPGLERGNSNIEKMSLSMMCNRETFCDKVWKVLSFAVNECLNRVSKIGSRSERLNSLDKKCGEFEKLEQANIVIGNLSFENVEKFRYLGVTLTNTSDIREEIKRRINMGNACYYSLEKILSSHLLSKKLKVKT